MLYKYKAVDINGDIVQSTIEADSRDESINILRGLKLRVISVEEDLQKSKALNFRLKEFSSRELSLLTLQLHIMIKSGVNLSRTLEILYSQEEDKRKKEIFQKIYRDLKEGESLYNSFKKTNSFPKLLLHMIKVGENSSGIESIFLNLSKHYEEEDRFNKKLKNATIYPLLLAVVSILVVNYLALEVIPTFSEVYESSGVQLPATTRFLINSVNFVKGNWILLIILFIFITIGIIFYFNTPRGRYEKGKFLVKAPIIHKFYEKILAKKFSGTMNTLLNSKMDIISALEICSETLDNTYILSQLKISAEQLTKGRDLHMSLKDTEIFPAMLISLIEVGEESSSLENVFKGAEEYYKYEMEMSSSKIISLLEPVLILIMALVVGFIVISLATPMFDMVNRI